MANKQEMKVSEARIIIYLSQTKITEHYVGCISLKLNIDYGYTLRILAGMCLKEWLRRDKSLINPNRTYYHLTDTGKALMGLSKLTVIQ